MDRLTATQREDVLLSQIIVICGNDVSGKSTFAQVIADRLDAPVVSEPFETNPFGHMYLDEPRRWAYHAEVEFVRQRVENVLSLRQSGHEIIVMDRSPSEDVYVFAQMWRARGVLTVAELQSLKNLLAMLEPVLPPVAGYIYLRCDLNDAMARLNARGFAPKDGDLRALTQMRQEFYDAWVAARQDAPVSYIDTSRTKIESYEEIADALVRQLLL